MLSCNHQNQSIMLFYDWFKERRDQMTDLPNLSWVTFLHEIKLMSQSYMLQTFIAIVILDLILGTLKAYLNHEMNSSTGVHGLAKNATATLVVLVIFYFLDLAQATIYANSFIILGIVQYANSCLENWCQMGFWCPDFIRQLLAKLQDQQGNLIKFKKDHDSKK